MVAVKIITYLELYYCMLRINILPIQEECQKLLKLPLLLSFMVVVVNCITSAYIENQSRHCFLKTIIFAFDRHKHLKELREEE